MSWFEEYAYCSYLKEQNKKQQEDIDKQIYTLLVKKQELAQEMKWVIEYQKSLVNEIVVCKKS